MDSVGSVIPFPHSLYVSFPLSIVRKCVSGSSNISVHVCILLFNDYKHM